MPPPAACVPAFAFAAVVVVAAALRRCRADPNDPEAVFETLHRPLDWEKVPSRSKIRGPVTVLLTEESNG